MHHDTAGPTMLDRFGGELLDPSDPGYEQARRVFNGAVDRRPALIARCRRVDDVIAALAYARDRQLPVAVRAGGHGVAGHGVVDGGLVLDLRPMRRVEVDPARRRARVEGGATWAELDRATQAHGLAVTGGRNSTVGVAGVTLGGGSGWLERSLGPSCDHLVAAEVVSADGRVAVLEIDLGTVFLDHPDTRTTRLVLDALIGGAAQGWIGRQLPRLLAAAGLVELRVRPRVVLCGLAFFRRLLAVPAAAALPADRLDRWWAELADADLAGYLTGGGTAFVASATKP